MAKGHRRHVVPRPFLKWVGGKGQLLEQLRLRMKSLGALKGYHEPFVGGGALFFDLVRDRALPKTRALLSDTNPNLIEAYLGVKQDVEGIIERLRAHEAAHSKEYFYEVRASTPDSLLGRAARIIYLNKTCFNGLYRENSKGKFNVPFGKYVNPTICDERNLREVANVLTRAEIESRPFETVLERAAPGDFVYFDPPYHPVSATSSFAAYARGGFGEADQRHLAEVFKELTDKGVQVLLSNSFTPFIGELYGSFHIDQVPANRAVNSKGSKRGSVLEVMVRNY